MPQKEQKMNKLVKFAIATLLTTVMAIGFAACGNSGNVDTFAGAISEESYDSQESAVEAFLENEISGDAVQAELQGIEEVGELSDKEVAALDTGDTIAADDTIVSAKVVEVSYTRTTSSAMSLAAKTGEEEEAEDDVFVFTVYVIEITPAGTTVREFRYYIPKAENGDVLTRSYFEDVLDPAKYVNCTQKYTAKSTTMGMSMNTEYTILCANDKATLEMRVPNVSSSVSGIYGYFEDGESFKAWISLDGVTYEETSVGSFSGVTDMEGFATLCIPDFDYSYFEKTSYGFKIQESFLETYVGKVLGYYGGTGLKAELKFYVKDGRLSEMKSNLSVTIDGVKSTSTESVKFSHFGTTVVNRPESIG